MNTKYYIKNMVCPRCIVTVQAVFKDLGIEVNTIRLGEVSSATNVNDGQKKKLSKILREKGFELLEDNKSKLIGQIKSIIIEHIHYNQENRTVNFSTLLSEKLNHEYTSLSKLFSSVEGITIERFILKQKIEKVKELLFYNQLTLSEIAYKMNYSSVAHLSAQFKKETGMTPSAFKKLRQPGHQPLDSI
jgi:AraC-like DNA-binding protein